MPDYFATYEDVQKFGGLYLVAQSKIEVFLPEAKREVVDRIGAVKYAEIFALGDENDDFLNLRAAEARMVLYYLIPTINISSSGDGITKARGVGDGRKENISELDVETIIKRHRESAEKILKDYALAVDNDEDEKPDQLITPGLSFSAISIDSCTDTE